MNIFKTFIGRAISATSKIPGVYKLSRKVVDYYRNENNCEILTNGEMFFLKKYCDKFETIFDVGANVGEWTIETARLSPKSKIYSFEPSKTTYKTLEENISKSDINKEKVSLNNIGLGETNESKTFYIYGDNSTLNSTHRREFPSKEQETIDIESIDSFCANKKIDKINFLKIDTEGNELSVLKGAHNMIKTSKIDSIQIEYCGTYINARVLLKDIFAVFKDTNYRVYKLYPNKLVEVQYTESLENFQYANYIVMLKDFSN